MIRLLRSSSLRLALGYAVLFVASSLVLVGILWWRTADVLDREIDAVILTDTQAIGDRLRDFGLAGALKTIDERVARAADEHAIYLLADPTLTPVAGNLQAWPLQVRPQPGWYQVELVRNDKVHATRLLYVVLPSGFRLIVGRDVEDRAAVRSLIVDGLGWAAAGAFVLALGGGVLVRRSVLRRVEAINRTAAAIVHGDLSRRLPTRNTADEFDQLAQTINVMLQQMQLLIEGVRNASNAVAHDLRTPLAELRSRLEELARTRPPAELAYDEIHKAVADIDRVIGIFNALLRLAEIDSGTRRSEFRPVDLSVVATEVAELYGPLIEDKEAHFVLAVPGGMSVNGDPFLLAQAIGNLLDNAVKYAPQRGEISLCVTRLADGRIEVSVADNGPGIAAAEKSRVTERFYRGEASVGKSGVGLGLSLVDAVARLHDGTLVLADNNPGLIARLTIPAAPAA